MIKGIDNFQVNNYNYNRINEAAQRKVQEQSLAEQRTASEKPEKKETSGIDLRLDTIRPRQNASLEDISLSLNDPKGFEMKGRDADIQALDMEKAVSDMQKDQALMQYQYFVGDTGTMNFEDGIVIAK